MILLQLPMGMLLAMFDRRQPALDHLPWVIIVGVTGFNAHYIMVKALRLLDASIAIPIDLFRVPRIALVGFYFYGEGIEIWLLVGALMIFGSNFYALGQEARAKLWESGLF